jgi:hypothetical protein
MRVVQYVQCIFLILSAQNQYQKLVAQVKFNFQIVLVEVEYHQFALTENKQVN